jgi:hypothetical protein
MSTLMKKTFNKAIHLLVINGLIRGTGKGGFQNHSEFERCCISLHKNRV